MTQDARFEIEADHKPIDPPNVVRLGHFRQVPINTPREVLIGAKAILASAAAQITKGWTRGGLAVDVGGFQVDPESKLAVAWTLHGAMRCATGSGFGPYSAADMAWRTLTSVVWEDAECTPEFFNNRVAKGDHDILAVLASAQGLIADRLANG
jgi:hypothetical protein